MRRRLVMDETWLAAALKTEGLTEAARRVIVTNAPATRGAWEVMATSDNPHDIDFYWETAAVIGVALADLGEASRQLIAHGRAWSALDMLTMALHMSQNPDQRDSGGPALDVVVDALDSALKQAPRPNEGSIMTGYNVEPRSTTSSRLASLSSVLARYEFAYYPLPQNSSRNKGIGPGPRNDRTSLLISRGAPTAGRPMSPGSPPSRNVNSRHTRGGYYAAGKVTPAVNPMDHLILRLCDIGSWRHDSRFQIVIGPTLATS